MTFQKLTYSVAGGIINGSIGNKNLRIVVRPAQAGKGPAAGNYMIHPPVNDPIYGMVAMMTHSTPSAHPTVAEKIANSPAAIKQAFSASTPQAQSSVAAYKFALSPAAEKPVLGAAKGTAERVFVLSGRPIPGQNSLVVSLGFADLMDALRAGGGASVTVS